MNALKSTDASSSPSSAAAVDWVEAHGDYLFHFALGQVRAAGVAEDLVQETFLAALQSRDRFAGQSSERTWLTGILRHKIYDHLRRSCRERAVRAEPGAPRDSQDAWDASTLWLHDVAEECVSPSRRMELAEFRVNLEPSLGQLPPRLAQVFRLYEMEDRSNHEVCASLGISENNLWVMLHRARKQLREQLAAWWNGEEYRTRSNWSTL